MKAFISLATLISPVSALSVTLGGSSSPAILLEEWVWLGKEQLMFAGWMERRSTIPPLAAASPGEQVGDVGHRREQSLEEPA